MHRYQCPRCSRFHDRDAEPKCNRRSLNYSPTCPTCVHLANQPCPGGVR